MFHQLIKLIFLKYSLLKINGNQLHNNLNEIIIKLYEYLNKIMAKFNRII